MAAINDMGPNDALIGTDGGDKIAGKGTNGPINSGDDVRVGGKSHDDLYHSRDRDKGWGNKEDFNGGQEHETAFFSGKVSEYSISFDDNTNIFTIEDTIANRDGVDVVKNVEVFTFSDFSSNVDCWM